MGIRTRLYLFVLLVVAVLSVASGLLLQGHVRDRYEEYTRRQLLEKARLTTVVLESANRGAGFLNDQEMDALVDELGKSADMRITVIAPDGHVRADSDLDGLTLAGVDNHGQRLEVVRARRDGIGAARRFSTTLGQDLLYIAVAGGPDGSVVRVAHATHEVDQALWQLRLVVVAAAGLGLLLASAVGALASHFAAKTLRSLVERARLIRGSARGDLEGEDEIGVLAGSLNHLADELDRTVARLGEERDRLETILRGTSEGVMALDADQRIRLINAAAAHLLKLPEGVEGRPVYEVTRDPDLLTLAERGASVSSTLEIVMSEGERIVVGRADPLQATGGTVLVLHDVSEMRRLEKMRREFVANVSHELRTPVSIIRANCETLIEGGAIDNEKARGNFLRAIARNAERLERLVADLLDLARIEAGKQELAPREISPRAIIERVVSLLSRRAEDRGLELIIDASPTLRVYTDEKALDQILGNLIDNAVKYSDKPGRVWIRARVSDKAYQRPQLGEVLVDVPVTNAGGAKNLVTFSSDDEGPENFGQLIIAVEDEGPGIPKASRGRVFERFYRVDAGRSRDVGGTGLGLSIVKHLAHLLDGHAGVEPRLPRGTHFFVVVPLKRVLVD